MQAVVRRQKGGHGPRRSMRRVETGDESATPFMYSLFLNNIIYRILWFCEEILGSSYILNIQRCGSFTERVVPQIILLKT